MRNFIKGFLVGLSLVTMISLAAYATVDQDFDAEEARSRCDVRVGYGHTTFGDSCRYDEVMVGTRNGNLLCADIEVTCQ